MCIWYAFSAMFQSEWSIHDHLDKRPHSTRYADQLANHDLNGDLPL